MSAQRLRKFYLSIVLPAFLAIALFITSIYVLIIPALEKNFMTVKKETISELTNTAWSLVDEFYQEYSDSLLSESEAQRLASSRVAMMRYGGESKDYFWITTKDPVMVMHPYRTELINTDLSNYADPNGKKLFAEAVKVVEENKEGFINYYWQWKDDSTRIVPKLSYVKEFEQWGWIIGTGIYLEDVREEIQSLQTRLLKISFVIILLIVLIIMFVIRQSLRIERKRTSAESQLKLSNQKYKSLVDASTEGTLMLIDDKIIFANQRIANIVGFETSEIMTKKIVDLFDIDWQLAIDKVTIPNKSLSLETNIVSGKNIGDEVILSISKIDYNSHVAIIVIAREISTKEKMEKETEQLTFELQTSLTLMNQPIKGFIEPVLQCNINDSITSAVKMMTRKSQDIIFVSNQNAILGVVNDYDLRVRVIAEAMDLNQPVSTIMTSPVMSIKEDALLYEAILMFNAMEVSHLLVKDNNGTILGKISNDKIYSVQKNSLSYLIREIELSENVKDLIGIQKRLPVLVKALLASGALIQNITRIVSSITDAITKRIIELTIEELGEPPCKFAFIALGSEARMEQSLATDQDNAIIFEDVDNIEEAQTYFLKMGEIVNQSLHQTGYKLCVGDIMARNPKWNQPFSKWKEYFTKWIMEPNPQSVLETNIFFDLRYIYGNSSFVDDLKDHINDILKDREVFFHHLAQYVTKAKLPLSMFGQLKAKEDDELHQNLDIKIIIVVMLSFIRVYSLKHNITATNSHQRMKKLKEGKIISKELYEELNQSYNYLMTLRFKTQANQLLNNETPDNIIDIAELSDFEFSTIKKILSVVSNLKNKLNLDFKGGM